MDMKTGNDGSPVPEVRHGASRILSALREGALPAIEIADKTGLSAKTVMTRSYIPALRTLGLIHVVAWRHGRNHLIPVFALAKNGNARDAPRPIPLTAAQRVTRYVEKNKDQVNLSRRLRRAKKEGRPLYRPVYDPVLIALGAMPRPIVKQDGVRLPESDAAERRERNIA